MARWFFQQLLNLWAAIPWPGCVPEGKRWMNQRAEPGRIIGIKIEAAVAVSGQNSILI
jgi:hypothetical protein